MNFSGKDAVVILNSMPRQVVLHRKDNTDKFWSYKIRGGGHSEFAFDPRTKTKLVLRFDRKPPRMPGVENPQYIGDERVSTALRRVFSGGLHTARYKAEIRDERSLRALVRALAATAGPTNSKLPAHGPINCRDCWKNLPESTKEQVSSDGKFKLVNDPGAWGTADPKLLVRGISKGNTQARAFAEGEFDEVPFKKCRPRLCKSLAVVGLMEPDDDIDSRMTRLETDFAFGSVVRFSVTGLRNGKWKAGTPEVIPAFTHPKASAWLTNCFERHLTNLSERLRIIVLAGNDDRWIKVVSSMVECLYTDDFHRVNDVAYRAGGKLWVHVGHPSPGNGHFSSFTSGTANTAQGRKRELARAAIGSGLNLTGRAVD